MSDVGDGGDSNSPRVGWPYSTTEQPPQSLCPDTEEEATNASKRKATPKNSDDNLDSLIEQGDWQGVIEAAKAATSEDGENLNVNDGGGSSSTSLELGDSHHSNSKSTTPQPQQQQRLLPQPQYFFPPNKDTTATTASETRNRDEAKPPPSLLKHQKSILNHLPERRSRAPLSNRTLLAMLGISWLFFGYSMAILTSLQKRMSTSTMNQNIGEIFLPPQHYNLSETVNDDILSTHRYLHQNDTTTTTTLNNDTSTLVVSGRATEETLGHVDVNVDVEPIETILIIATVPYDFQHAMGVWSHLECMTDGIDRVIISAPDAQWSRDVVTSLIDNFHFRNGNATTFTIEVAYYVNNRYDAGLWCDALTHRLGYDGTNFLHNGTVLTNAKPRAIYLINDSSVSLIKYDAITQKVLMHTRRELHNKKTGVSEEEDVDTLRLISLNGILKIPTIRSKYYVESVYRGLTPIGLSKFYGYSCVNMGYWCKNMGGKHRKTCIVDHYEKGLANAYKNHEFDAMYPSNLPSDWDVTTWVANNIPFVPYNLWIDGGPFFRYLVEEQNFPIRKTKKAHDMMGECLSLVEIRGDVSWFKKLPFPSGDVLRKFMADMLDSANKLPSK